MEIVAIDFETADNGRDSACAVGLVRIVDGQVTDTDAFLIRPPREEFLFTHIHGITWNDVEDADPFEQAWPRFSKFLEAANFFVAHYAEFDRGVLRACCEMAGLAAPETPFLCTVRLARQAWDIRPTKLPDVCAHFGIPLIHHDHASDAMACAKITVEAISQDFAIESARLK